MGMIGQKRLLEELSNLVAEDKLPRFIILVGERDEQASEIAPYIAGLMQTGYIRLNDVKVDTIRQMIDEAYDVTEPVVFNIADADGMSAAAKNSMLKVVEEPPNKSYFIMNLTDLANTLETIKSRASVFYMDKYSKEELMEYYNSKYQNKDEKYKALICSLADTPLEIDILDADGNGGKFIEYVENFAEKVFQIDGSKALNLTDKVSVKDGDDKYDAIMFFKIYQHICLKQANKENNSQEISKYCQCVILAGKYIQQIRRVKGINKQMLLDEFVLKVRKIWK